MRDEGGVRLPTASARAGNSKEHRKRNGVLFGRRARRPDNGLHRRDRAPATVTRLA